MLNYAQVATVNKLMLKAIASYCTTFGKDDDSDQLEMYADDIAHNAAALAKFNDTKDWQQFYNDVYEQDTIAREEFYEVLDYMSDNGLAKNAYV